MEEATGLKISSHCKAKDKMVEPMCERLHQIQQQNMPVLVVRQDSTGENKSLEKRCKSEDWKLNIKFKYTANNTHQTSLMEETGFTYIAAKMRAAMNADHIPSSMRHRLWPNALTALELWSHI